MQALAEALPANQPFKTFDDSLVLGFWAQIGNEAWGADSVLTIERAYETDAGGALTKIAFDFRNANGNSLSVIVDQWRTLSGARAPAPARRSTPAFPGIVPTAARETVYTFAL